MAVAVAVAVAMAVSASGAVAVAVPVTVPVPVAGLTKRFFNHIPKDFLINVWGYWAWRLQREILLFGPKKWEILFRSAIT